MSSYLQQLKSHRKSLELTLQQCDNDIQHNQRGIELLQQQKDSIENSIKLIDDSIKEEDDNA